MWNTFYPLTVEVEGENVIITIIMNFVGSHC